METIKAIIKSVKPRDIMIRKECRIDALLTDSRSLTHPMGVLFIALVTRHGDGHDYILELYEKGITNFLISKPISEFKNECPDANFIRVSDTLRALQDIAREHRKKFKNPVIGITGSNGKTIVKEFLNQLLHEDVKITRSPRSYNSQIGVPLSVWNLKEDDQLGIFEAGISRPGEMETLERIIKPTIGVITSIGTAHQENFNTISEKIEEKLQLFVDADCIVYNADDKQLSAGIRNAGLDGRGIGWSRVDTSAPLFIRSVVSDEETTEISFRNFGMERKVKVPFTDRASIEDIIHCIAVILQFKPALLSKADRFMKLDPVAMRLELKEGSSCNTVINDSYNNDFNALEIALDFQKRRARKADTRKVLVLSDILESGMLPRTLYKQVASLLKECGIDQFIGVGKDLCKYKKCFSDIEDTAFFDSTADLIDSKVLDMISNSCILLKGARQFRFEQLCDKLSRQIHETTLEINLQAIQDNVAFYRSKINPSTKMVCMVKAQGYGVGSYELAKTLQSAHVDYLAVALADEGKELRERDIDLPIMVMNPEPSTWRMLFDYRLEPEIFSFGILEEIMSRAAASGLHAYPIHIKIDSGMHRLGFLPSDIPKLGKILSAHPEVRAMSVFSHLAAADDPALDNFTLKQISTFDKAAGNLEKYLPYKPVKHILNTAGIERFSEYQFDMVRLGIGLYGCSPNRMEGLERVIRLRTTILQVKDIPAGEPIGYGCHGTHDKPVKIAILPIGYADGYRRQLGRGVGKVLIGDKLCKTIGNICMDTCMIDVTDVPNVAEGQKVTLFGDARLTIEQLAEWIDTIPYELLALLSTRVKRVYYRE